METIEGDLAQIMHDIRPEGASYVVVVNAAPAFAGDIRPIEAAHGPFKDWSKAMAWAVKNDGTVIPLFPIKDNG
jgi:hypothetical protein